MYGIAGSQRAFSSDLLVRMSEPIAHRGPHEVAGQGIVGSTDRCANRLAPRRLPIIGLTPDRAHSMTARCARCGMASLDDLVVTSESSRCCTRPRTTGIHKTSAACCGRIRQSGSNARWPGRHKWRSKTRLRSHWTTGSSIRYINRYVIETRRIVRSAAGSTCRAVITRPSQQWKEERIRCVLVWE